tara:strand:- start:619 stop:849 length:231 start_codon:yes stop_codon:yes gene_type:complete
MKLTKDQINWIIFALEREIDLEDMGYEEIIKFAKEENGQDPLYKIELQEIVDEFETYLDKENNHLSQQHILSKEEN